MNSYPEGTRTESGSSTVPIILLCGAIAAINGFGTQAIGFAAGSITKDWSLSESLAGTFFSAGFAGAIIGAIIAGYGYRLLGKRAVLCFWLCWVAAGTFLNAVATDYVSLIAIRVVTGLGIGAIIPILTTIVTEAASDAARGRALSLVVAGSPIGGVICGGAYGLISVHLGWRSIFVVGVILTLLMVPGVLAIIPPSTASERAANMGGKGALAQTLRSIVSLFTDGRAFAMIAIMTAAFAGTGLAITLTSWTPLLLKGFSLSESMSAAGGVALNSGALLGIFGFGTLLDRVRSGSVVGIGFSLGCGFLLLSGYVSMGVDMRLAVMVLIGFFAIGPVSGIWYLVSSVYTGDERIDAMAIGLIAARTGAVVGPIYVGLLVGAGLESGDVYGALSLIEICTAVCIGLFLIRSRSQVRRIA